MSLSITPTDVLTNMSTLFNVLWPLLALGLGIKVVPMIFRAAGSVFSR